MKISLIIMICLFLLFIRCTNKKEIINEVKLESVSLDPTFIIFNNQDNSINVRFKNLGDIPVKWKIIKYDSLILCSRDSDTFDAKEKDSVYLFLNPHADITELIQSKVAVSINGKLTILPITIYNLAVKKLSLSYNVNDAEYDTIHNRIVCVSDYPANYLRIVDPQNLKCDSIKLDYAPTCVAISPDATKAAVGHNAHVTYIDLIHKTVLAVYNLNCKVYDIDITREWAYAFSEICYVGAFNIDLSNGNIFIKNKFDFYYYNQPKAKLHPSGKFIYALDDYSSYMEKFDISSDTLIYLDGSRYHHNYFMGSDFWYSENGDRIFAKNGNIFKTSEIFKEDFSFVGNLKNTTDIISLCHSSEANRIYAISNEGETHLDIYDGTSLSYLGKLDFEKFKKNDGRNGYKSYSARGRFVFIDTTGKYAYVITRVVPEAGLLCEWGIEKISIN